MVAMVTLIPPLSYGLTLCMMGGGEEGRRAKEEKGAGMHDGKEEGLTAVRVSLRPRPLRL